MSENIMHRGYEITDPMSYALTAGRKKIGTFYMKDPQGQIVTTERGNRKIFQYKSISKKDREKALQKAMDHIDSLLDGKPAKV